MAALQFPTNSLPPRHNISPVDVANPRWPPALWQDSVTCVTPFLTLLNTGVQTRAAIKISEQCALFPRCYFSSSLCVCVSGSRKGGEVFLSLPASVASVWISVSLCPPLPHPSLPPSILLPPPPHLCVYSLNSTWKISNAGHRGALGSIIDANSQPIWKCPSCFSI